LQGGDPLKLLFSIFISLTFALPAQALLLGNAGHGDPQGGCAYPETEAPVYKSQTVINIENKLKVATDKRDELEKDLSRLDCSYCESNFRKVISIIDKDNYNEYIRHLEGGSSCSTAFNNVDVYNHWASLNNWEKIELYTRPKQIIRNIAGGCPEGQTCGELGDGEPDRPSPPPVSRPEIEPPVAPPGCPYYAGPNYTVKPEACEVAKPHISTREYRKCVKCVSPRDRRSYGKCLRESAHLEEQLAELEMQIEELELDLEDAIEDAEDSGERGVCTNCPEEVSAGRKWILPVAGGVVGGALGYYLGNKLTQDSYDEKVAYNQTIQDDNNAKGYPSSPFQHENNSKRNGILAGLAGGAALFYAGGKASGAIGCSNSSIFGDGLLTSGSGAGTQVGGATGISGLLSGLIGKFTGSGSSNDGNTNGVTTGQGIAPPGWVLGANGQWVNTGGAGGANGQGGLSTGQIDAQIAANQAQLAQLSAQRTYQASYNTLTNDYYANLSTLQRPPSLNGNIYGQGGSSGVMAPSSNSVLQGGVSLNLGLGANAGVGVLSPQHQQQQLPGTFWQPPTTTAPIGAPGNVVPPTSTSPAGINRLIGN
jgi:hypothetical protein